MAIHEQAPDLLVGNSADKALAVHAAIAQRAASPVGLGDLGREGDDALEARSDLLGANLLRSARGPCRGGLYLAHCTRFLG